MFKLSAATLLIATAVVSQTSMALPFVPTGIGHMNIKAADKDNNGAISKDEFNSYFVTGQDARDTRGIGKNVAVGADKKGRTDLVVSETGVTKNTDPLTPQEAAAIYQSADTNGDGQITREEFGALHKALMEREDAKIFAFVDANQDGYISRKEAAERAPTIAENFAKIDTNNDGKISPDELKAAHKKLKKKMMGQQQSPAN